MAHGGLMQLAAIGAQNYALKNKDIYSTEYYTMKFQNNKLEILRNADLCIPLHIIIKMKNEMDSGVFSTLISNSSLKFFINGLLFIDLGLTFLIKLNPIKKVNDSFIIKLPIDILIGHISQVSLSCSMCNIKLDTECKEIDEISGLFEWILQDSAERRKYAQKIIYQKILYIKFITSVKNNDKNDSYNYRINFDNEPNKLGFFIESENKIKTLDILLENKSYALKNCSVINDKLLYLSFNNLTYENKQNLSVTPIKIMNIVVVNSMSDDLKFYSHSCNIVNYRNGHMYQFSQIYSNYDLCNCKNDVKYNMYKNIMDESIVINEIKNKKVCNFQNTNVNNYSIQHIMNDVSFSIIRLVKCTVDLDLLLPPHINTIILENCKTDFTNIPYHINKVWLIRSAQQTNLPVGLKKLRLFGDYDVKNMKLPFNCEVEYVPM